MTVDMINVINLVNMVDKVNIAKVSSHEFKMVDIEVGAIKRLFIYDNAKGCSDLSQGNSAFPRLDVELWTLMKP